MRFSSTPWWAPVIIVLLFGIFLAALVIHRDLQQVDVDLQNIYEQQP